MFASSCASGHVLQPVVGLQFGLQIMSDVLKRSSFGLLVPIAEENAWLGPFFVPLVTRWSQDAISTRCGLGDVGG